MSENNETPVETKTEIPVETKTETPVETKTETPVETKTETPVETKTEIPIKKKTEKIETVTPNDRDWGEKTPRKGKKSLVLLSVLGVLVLLFLVMEIVGFIMSTRNHVSWSHYLHTEKIDTQTLAKLEKESRLLQKKIAKEAPKRVYLIIDTASNVLLIKKGSETQRQVVVSCGSGNILQEPSGKRTWVFDTPRGGFKVQSKLKKPVWVKPDWAFIEEGKAIPNDQEERLEPGVMGDYAMGFGDGYFVHGTLYTRLLGRNVTHGCVRVGDEDLKNIFKSVSIGTTLYIF